MIASAAQGLTIDDFSDGALRIVPAATTLDFQYVMSSGVILGGDREETITNMGIGVILAGEISPDSWTYGASNALGTAILVWDGPGGVFPGVDAAGLGGEDLTEAGAHDAIHISVLSNDLVANLTLTVYTSAADFSTIDIATEGSAGSLFAAFADFVDTGGGADFANVGAVTLEIDGLGAPSLADLDLTFEHIETAGLVPAPEPGTAAMLAFGLVLLSAARRAQRRA